MGRRYIGATRDNYTATPESLEAVSSLISLGICKNKSDAIRESVVAYSLIKTEISKGSTISITKPDGTVAELIFI